MPRPLLPVAATLWLAAVMLALSADAAGAHAVLAGADPDDGERVDEALDEVTLEFSEAVGFPEVEVADPDGASVTAGAPVVEGEVVRQPLAALEQEGRYSLAYRVVSEDDHPVEGELVFTYEGPLADGGSGDPEGAAASEPSEDADGDRPVTDATADGEPADGDEGNPGAAAEGEASGSPSTLVAAGLIVAALGAAAWLALRRRGGSAA